MPSLPPPAVEDPDPAARRFGRIPTADGGFIEDAGYFVARVNAEGRVAFEDETSTASFSSLTIFGRFGAVHADPAKQQYLEATFDERSLMRVRFREATMEAALDHLPRYLAAIWRYDAWTPAVRKRILFELWDECAEHGGADLVEAGRAARTIIVSFVRRYLPPGSDEAYSEDELRALNNERTSAEAFDPYVVSSGAGGRNDASRADPDRFDVGAGPVGLR